MLEMTLPLLLTGFEILVICFLLSCCYGRPACLSVLTLLAAVAVGGLDALRGYTWHVGPVTSDSVSITNQSSMLAATCRINGFDIAWGMARVPVPHHSDISLLIRVKAVAVNPSNFKHPMIPAAWPFLRHLREWPVGYDVSGEVLSVGTAGACDVKVGDHVWGMSLGIAAEYAVLPCFLAVSVPGRLSFAEAAGLGVAGLTSMQAYERHPVQPGQNVLVIGASGGVGQFGVSLANAMGANVTGVCGTQNTDFVRQLQPGLSLRVVDYKSKVQMDALASQHHHFDLVYDTVSSNAPEDPNYEPLLRPTLKKGGAYVAIGPCPDPLDQLRSVADALTRPLMSLQREGYDNFLLSPSKELMLRLNSFFDSGQLQRVAIDSIHDLKASDRAILDALEKQKSRRAVGKIILTFGE